MSERNTLAEGERFVAVAERGGAELLHVYRARFPDQVEERHGRRRRAWGASQDHPQVHNEDDEARPSTERMWDISLAERLSDGQEIMYGLAVDAHNYHDTRWRAPRIRRGWVMVRSVSLSAEALVVAMEAGDFYGTSGVLLDNIVATNERMSIGVRSEPGVRYRVRFIGTRDGYDRSKEELELELEDASVLYRYSDDIGEILAEIEETSGTYTFEGDELYVRLKIVSTKLKKNPYRQGEHEAA